jgi:pimeloyl-ACP methyl ester carboxylesterase
MAPHVLVEDVTLKGIRDALELAARSDLLQRLGRHHADAGAVFKAWHQIWLSLAFRSWNIEEYLPSIPCPVMALQGEDDEYGSFDQIDRIARQAKDVDRVKLADCRHSPHKDQTAAVIDAVTGFVARILDSRE